MKVVKGDYIKPVVILHIICLLSIVGFKFFTDVEINNSYFMGFLLMSFLMLKEFKNDIDSESVFSWATFLVIDLCYVLVMFFKFGRFFVSNL
ncbi:MAG TPA: hypothetical protein GXZ90_03005 [Clostridiales bacterium]|nr:hypothetical protein [Clostridiales bacterium]